jgi:hypothetical protein
MYHHDTKATVGVVAYHHVHDITNEKFSDRKKLYVKRE